MGVLDLAEIVSRAESPYHFGTHGGFGGNDEVGMPEKDLDEGGAVIEARVQEKQIAFLEALDELVNESMFRSACLAVNEAQGCTADQIKQTAKLDRNRSQSLLAPVCAETRPKSWRFGQSEGGLVTGKQTQPVPTAALIFAGGLQPCDQRTVQPGESVQGKNAHELCRRQPRKSTIGWEAVRSPSGGFRKGWIDGYPTTPPTSARPFLTLPTCGDAATPFSDVVGIPARTQGLGRAIGQEAEDQVLA